MLRRYLQKTGRKRKCHTGGDGIPVGRVALPFNEETVCFTASKWEVAGTFEHFGVRTRPAGLHESRRVETPFRPSMKVSKKPRRRAKLPVEIRQRKVDLLSCLYCVSVKANPRDAHQSSSSCCIRPGCARIVHNRWYSPRVKAIGKKLQHYVFAPVIVHGNFFPGRNLPA
jgi:hypothetical protein